MADQKVVPQNEQKDLSAEIAALQQQRLKAAEAEINAILEKYNVELRGIVTIPTSMIQLVPK